VAKSENEGQVLHLTQPSQNKSQMSVIAVGGPVTIKQRIGRKTTNGEEVEIVVNSHYISTTKEPHSDSQDWALKKLKKLIESGFLQLTNHHE